VPLVDAEEEVAVAVEDDGGDLPLRVLAARGLGGLDGGAEVLALGGLAGQG
jgi:hypothetical protein